MADYNKIYSQNKKVWGMFPNKFLQIIWQKASSDLYFLDLGCGQGRDSIFMAKNNFKVDAVDKSAEAIKNIDNTVAEEKLVNINTHNKTIEDFVIEKDEYSIINIFNSLWFIERDKMLKVVDDVRNNLAKDGFVVIVNFNENDPSYKPEKGFFKTNELFELFKDFEIVLYEEANVYDVGHPGSESPHRHGISRLVAKKIK